MHQHFNREIEIDLTRRIRNSDQEAFKQIYLHYFPSVYKQIYYRAGNEELCRDIVQEAFIKCWNNRENLNTDHSLFAYIVTIGNNLLINHFKHQKVKEGYREQAEKQELNSPPQADSDIQMKELKAKINSIVTRHLPKQCQTIFIMSRFDEKSNDEIADILKISKKTVENQLYNALKVIRKKLDKKLWVYSIVWLY